jgi:hypothetical protein
MRRTSLLAIGLAFGLTTPAVAGETVTEHETYEKRSMKVETMGATTTTTRPSRVERTYEETETRRVEQAPAPKVVEKKTTVVGVPPPVVREKTTEHTETED